MKKIKVLHIVPNMQAGGLETLIMNFMRNIDKNKIQFDFLVHYKEKKFYDDEIKKLKEFIEYYYFYKNKCHELNMDKYVNFVGRKKKEEVAKLLSKYNNNITIITFFVYF